MAYVNGNKPIVTNGLIYALDFGNTRSYNSGSTTAKSLAFDQATTSVSGSPIFNNGILDFTSTKFIKRDGSLSALDPNGTFTVMIVGNAVSSNGTLLKQDSLNATLSTTGSLFGFGLESGDFSRSYPGFTSSSLQHVTYRYSQGTIDTFINGIPVTASAANSALTTTAVSNALFLGSGSVGFSGSLAQFYVYNRALSSDEIYETYLVSAERNGLPTISKPYSIDENVYKYVQTTGITDNDTISAISTFVSDLKSNGLWNKMTAIYPFLTTATGSQAVNLKDPGVLAVDYSGSYIASSTGPVPATSTDYIDLTGIKPTYAYPGINSGSSHFTALSYDPQSQVGFLGGTGLRAAGGDLVVSSGSRVYHAFLTTGTSSFIMLDPTVTDVEVLVVAGGGGGGTRNGNSQGGGGGAGGLVYSSSFSITPNLSVEVVVGDGGVGGTGTNSGTNGNNSVFSTVTALGGGGGGSSTGLNGGSGGGGGSPEGSTTPLIGSPGGSGSGDQGNEGGWGTSRTTYPYNQAGGGGGHGSPGLSQSLAGTTGPSGGSGSYFPQFTGVGGLPVGWFAGGGGGAVQSGPRGFGGIGGGGIGGLGASTTSQGPGVINTGGGGGGAYRGIAGNGGSGIVIVSYDAPATALTGSGTGLYITEDAITGSVNNGFTAGITGSGTIGFLTVSRTGSNSYSLRKNNQQATINLVASASLTTDFFLGGANQGRLNLPLPARISYASVGAGLTDSEVSTYYNLVSQFQTNLKRQNTLLDNYSGAAAAYSLRRIGPSGYFGPAIRVRRDSDNALRDIGFTSDGQLDTVGLLDFVGVTGSGFVQTWYDQSGNNKHGIGGSPIIVSSGSIFTDGIKPALRFRGAVTGFPDSFNTGLSISQPFSYITSYRNSETGWYSVVFNGGNNNSNWLYTINGTTNIMWAGNGSVQTPLSHDLEIAYGEFNLANTTFYINNTLKSSGNPGTENTPNMYIGGGNLQLKGTLQELHFYPGVKSSIRNDLHTNLNNYYKIFGSATASFDPDYQAFITATGITEPTQSAALETLVSDLKSYGLWSKMKAIYPMVTDKNNRFAQSEDFSSTWNAVSSSVTVNQITAPNGTSTADLIREEAGTGDHYVYQTVDTLVSGNEYVLSVYGRFLNRPWIALQTNDGAQAWFNLQTGVTGSFTGSRATITPVSGGWYRCALFYTASSSGAKNQHIHLADANGNYNYTGVATTGSYLWGAQFENGNLLGPYRATTTVGFTTGSMLDQMKFNLRNPADTDAAFRLVYSGSWNPGYSGVRGDGSTAYADTKLKPNLIMTFNNQHYTVYKTDIRDSGADLGSLNLFFNGSWLRLTTGSFNGSVSNNSSPDPFTITTKAGNFILNRTTSTRKQLYKNSPTPEVKVDKTPTDVQNYAIGNIFIGAVNRISSNSDPFATSTPTEFSKTEIRLTTIGDGLTDYEAKALYWIVQKFQTTLGRQVY
jgi:hypothetical protein